MDVRRSPWSIYLLGIMPLLIPSAMSQGEKKPVGVVSILVLDAYGEPRGGDTEIRFKGPGDQGRKIIQTRGTIKLPYGAYTFSGWNGNAIAPDRIIVVRQPQTQIVFALTWRGPGDGWEASWRIAGKVTPAPRKGEILVGRLIALYSDAFEDAVVREDGSFTIDAWRMGPYKLWVLRGGKRVAELDLDIDPLTPRNPPPLQIRLAD